VSSMRPLLTLLRIWALVAIYWMMTIIPSICCSRDARSDGAQAGAGISGDQSSALQATINSAAADGCFIDGAGLTFRVITGIDMPAGSLLQNIMLFQRAQLGEAQTIRIKADNVTLRNVRVKREEDLSLDAALIGGPSSAGIWIEGQREAKIHNIIVANAEVWGNAMGSGIYAKNVSNLLISRAYIHDISYKLVEPPAHEVITGILLIRVEDVLVAYPRVSSLGGSIGSTPWRAFQTDGITVASGLRISIHGGFISATGEGIDFTGTQGNTDFEVSDVTVSNADSWAFKFANSARRGFIHDNQALNSGLAGFVVSAPAPGDLPWQIPGELFFYQNTVVISESVNPNWAANRFHNSGMLILGSESLEGSPERIFFRRVKILGSGANSTYGIYAENLISPLDASVWGSDIRDVLNGNVGTASSSSLPYWVPSLWNFEGGN
jgi:hypothetical protein